MTDIRELLLEATEDVEPSRRDPVGWVTRAVSRRRRMHLAVAIVVVAVAAAVAVPLALTRGGSSSPHPASGNHHALVERWEPDDGEVAAGFGHLWSLACCGRVQGTSWVDELDPETGSRIARISVPAPTSMIAAGAGRVWVIGANAGGGGPSAITAIDPATRQVSSLTSRDPHAAPYAITFAAGSAWITVPEMNEVWRVTAATGVRRGLDPGFGQRRIHVPGMPWTIAATGSGEVWVQQLSSGSFSRIAPTRFAGRVGRSVPWPGRLYVGRHGVLVAASRRVTLLNRGRFRECRGARSCPPPVSVPVHGQVLSALETRRGLFVSTTRRTYFFAHYFGGPVTASTEYHGATLAPDGDGVVIGGENAGLIHWDPAS